MPNRKQLTTRANDISAAKPPPENFFNHGKFAAAIARLAGRKQSGHTINAPTIIIGPLPIKAATITPITVVRTFPAAIKTNACGKLNFFCEEEKMIALTVTATKRTIQELVSIPGPPTTLIKGRIGSHALAVSPKAKTATALRNAFCNFTFSSANSLLLSSAAR